MHDRLVSRHIDAFVSMFSCMLFMLLSYLLMGCACYLRDNTISEYHFRCRNGELQKVRRLAVILLL